MRMLRKTRQINGLLGQGILILMDEGSTKIKLELPDDVRFIIDTIRHAGYEACVVGGCVRDSLLGKKPEDWDITTSALPLQVKSLFKNTVDTGIKHGTVMVIRNKQGYEVTTYRIDGEYIDGRHPESVEFTPVLGEDLKRRDFTINALAYDPEGGVVDLFGGISDLKNGIIRAVGDPRKRFEEDALRIMRAVRFSAQLSFDIEENTRNAISQFASNLEMVSAERKRVELEKTICSDNPAHVCEYRKLGLSKYIVPDVWDRCFNESSAAVMEAADDPDPDRKKLIRLAAFFMEVSAEECAHVMRKMTFDNRSRDLVSGILRFRSGSPETQGGLEPDAPGIRKLLAKTGRELFELILAFREACQEDLSEVRRVYEQIIMRGNAFSISMLNIKGDDLIKEGIPKGKQVGETLNMLLDKVVEDPGLNTKETLLRIVRGEL